MLNSQIKTNLNLSLKRIWHGKVAYIFFFLGSLFAIAMIMSSWQVAGKNLISYLFGTSDSLSKKLEESNLPHLLETEPKLYIQSQFASSIVMILITAAINLTLLVNLIIRIQDKKNRTLRMVGVTSKSLRFRIVLELLFIALIAFVIDIFLSKVSTDIIIKAINSITSSVDYKKSEIASFASAFENFSSERTTNVFFKSLLTTILLILVIGFFTTKKIKYIANPLGKKALIDNEITKFINKNTIGILALIIITILLFVPGIKDSLYNKISFWSILVFFIAITLIADIIIKVGAKSIKPLMKGPRMKTVINGTDYFAVRLKSMFVYMFIVVYVVTMNGSGFEKVGSENQTGIEAKIGENLEKITSYLMIYTFIAIAAVSIIASIHIIYISNKSTRHTQYLNGITPTTNTLIFMGQIFITGIFAIITGIFLATLSNLSHLTHAKHVLPYKFYGSHVMFWGTVGSVIGISAFAGLLPRLTLGK